MCRIVCTVTYYCGHKDPWVQLRDCQFDAKGHRKPCAKDPLCLLYGHCWDFGRVRNINISDGMLCTSCHIEGLEKKIKNEKARNRAIEQAKRNQTRASDTAQRWIEESEQQSRLEELSNTQIKKATGIALKRLDIAFSDAQMQSHHFEELLQIVIGLPLLDKEKLVGRFASKSERKFGPAELRRLHKLSIEYRNFGDAFRNGLKNPSLLDEPPKAAVPV